MNMSDWPQWLVMFFLILPVLVWPLARLAGVTSVYKKAKPRDEWIVSYIIMVIGQAIGAFVLYSGGFWS